MGSSGNVSVVRDVTIFVNETNMCFSLWDMVCIFCLFGNWFKVKRDKNLFSRLIFEFTLRVNTT